MHLTLSCTLTLARTMSITLIITLTLTLTLTLLLQEEIRIINENFYKIVNLQYIAKILGCGIFFNEDQILDRSIPVALWLLAFPPTTTGKSHDTYDNATVREIFKGGLHRNQLIIVELAPLYGLTKCTDFKVEEFERLPEYDLFVQRQMAVYKVYLKYAMSCMTVIGGDMVCKSTWEKLQTYHELKPNLVNGSSRQSSSSMISSYLSNAKASDVGTDENVDLMFNLYKSPGGHQVLKMAYHPTYHMLVHEKRVTRVFFGEIDVIVGLLNGKTIDEITSNYVLGMKNILKMLVESGRPINEIHANCSYILHVDPDIVKYCILDNKDIEDTRTFVCMIEAMSLDVHFRDVWTSAVIKFERKVACEILHAIPTCHVVKQTCWDMAWDLVTIYGLPSVVRMLSTSGTTKYLMTKAGRKLFDDIVTICELPAAVRIFSTEGTIGYLMTKAGRKLFDDIVTSCGLPAAVRLFSTGGTVGYLITEAGRKLFDTLVLMLGIKDAVHIASVKGQMGHFLKRGGSTCFADLVSKICLPATLKICKSHDGILCNLLRLYQAATPSKEHLMTEFTRLREVYAQIERAKKSKQREKRKADAD